MKTFASILPLGLAGLAAAHPAVEARDRPTRTGKVNGQQVVSYVAKFDDVVNTGLAPGVPVRGITPLGPYDSLYYDNLGVINDGAALAGVKPFSKPNVLAYDIVAEGQGQQTIRADYDDSITDFFNFKSFYFGCVLSTQETADSAPLNCQVQIQGYRNQQQVASQVATFTTDGLASSMDKVTLNSGFSNVDQVTFDTQGLNALLAGVLLDNLAYDVHLKKGKTIS